MIDDQLMRRVRPLRERGHSPKEIARALGVRPAEVAPLIRMIAEDRPAAEPEIAGCWVSPGWSDGLGVEGHPDWTDAAAQGGSPCGLVGVLVARRSGHGKVSVCGYLVDVYCLGVKDALGPHSLDGRELSGFARRYFAAYPSSPVAVPIDLARHLVFGAIESARGLGFEPAPDFEPARGHLEPYAGTSDIRFGRNGKPFFMQGARDDATRICRTLEHSVGRDGFDFPVPLDLADGASALDGRVERRAWRVGRALSTLRP